MTDAKDPMLTAALVAQTGEPIGPEPSDDELRAWASRSLNERRREEVESHIAHCPATCERAVAFLGKDIAAPAPSARITLYGLWPWEVDYRWFGAVCIIFVALMTFDIWRTQTSRVSNEAPRVERSALPDIKDWRLAAFMSGFLDQDEADLAMLGDAARVPASCLDGDRCAQLPDLVRELGVTLRQLDADCRANRAASAATRGHLEQLEPRLRASLELAPWSQVTTDLLRVPPEQPQAACHELEQLKQRSFAPRRLN